jgi:hypothetical protein
MSVTAKKVSAEAQEKMNSLTKQIGELVRELGAEGYTGELIKGDVFSAKIRWATPVITSLGLPEAE